VPANKVNNSPSLASVRDHVLMPKPADDAAIPDVTLSRMARTPKTAEVLAHQIRKDIANGVLKPGGMLPPEHALQEALGVSRQTLREAFRILESEHLISVQRGVNGGARVNAPELGFAARAVAVILQYRSANIADLYGAHALIENEATKRLAATRTKADVRALKTLLRQHEQALREDPLMWWAVSSAFHSAIVDRLGNETLSTFHGIVGHLLRRAGHHAAHNVSDEGRYKKAEQYQAVHEEVVEIIEAGDMERTGTFWEAHNQDVQKTVVRAYGGLTILELVD